MFEYLKKYGVKSTQIEFDEIDINDRLRLQDQINLVRRNYHSLLKLHDSVQADYLKTSEEMSKRYKTINQESLERVTNTTLNMDDEYTELEYKQQALKSGLSEIQMMIEFCKSDLRILNSVFYNKF